MTTGLMIFLIPYAICGIGIASFLMPLFIDMWLEHKQSRIRFLCSLVVCVTATIALVITWPLLLTLWGLLAVYYFFQR